MSADVYFLLKPQFSYTGDQREIKLVWEFTWKGRSRNLEHIFFPFILHLSILPISNYSASAAPLIAADYCSRKQTLPSVYYN